MTAITARDITMVEPQVYLEKLSAFSRMLRLDGFAVGPQETADAARILTVVGMEDKDRVKTALRTVYAKSREEQLRFDKVFDGFFISEEQMRRQAEEFMRHEEEMRRAMEQAQQELMLGGKPMDLSKEQREAYSLMPEEERQKLQKFMERYKGNAERNPVIWSTVREVPLEATTLVIPSWCMERTSR